MKAALIYKNSRFTAGDIKRKMRAWWNASPRIMVKVAKYEK